MNLYLDDDSIFSVLIQLLRQAGHDVLLPVDLGIAGAADAVHLRHAIREQRVFLTHNDFRYFSPRVGNTPVQASPSLPESLGFAPRTAAFLGFWPWLAPARTKSCCSSLNVKGPHFCMS